MADASDDPIDTDVPEHRWLGVTPGSRRRHIALCSCGWASPAYASAGLAGSAMDLHREEQGRR